MDDRQLLEDAARAAGLHVGFVSDQLSDLAFVWNDDKKTSRWWRPLTDDGDALRLAVKLNIEFICDDEFNRANAGCWRASTGPGDNWNCLTPYNGDKLAATRRAITRAAAAIGRQKEAGNA